MDIKIGDTILYAGKRYIVDDIEEDEDFVFLTRDDGTEHVQINKSDINYYYEEKH